jgi:alkanesulfonate monooxygenase SsuD/methylene tetrahydromethanopterin reductase-like flavin-dependent oxidoreductase (luciferase family)
MAVKVGYLLPTRERIMVGIHETGPILSLAERAEALGLDSVWIGDSLLAKPRHDALALIAAIAARTRRIAMGTAVLLPMLRNPVLLAHQVATIDQISEGRLILGVGTARDVPAIRNEFEAAGVPFEKRIGRMIEQLQLCRALWTGGKVDWEGRWTVKGAELAPRPFTPGGPPIWSGGGAPGALKRAGRYYDGWFPSGPGNGKDWREGWRHVQAHAAEAGRDPGTIVGAAYITISIDDDQATAEAALDHYLESYYLLPAATIRGQQYCFAGSRAAATAWLRGTGSDDERQMETLAEMREEIS